MKKTISILFLLLTSIAVVVHAVVPHHHHNKLFTSAISFLGEGTSTLFDHHDDAKFIHHVSDVVISVYDAQQSTVDVLPLQACPIDNSLLYQADLYGIPIILKPYLASGYPAVIINSLGLRAPPFC